MVRWKPCLAALALAMVAAGCGKVPSSGEPVWVEPVCPKDGALGPGPVAPGQEPTPRSVVPDGFVTAWVLRCRTEIRDLPSKGRWSVIVTERADTDAAELVEQLRTPSDPRSTDACTLEMVVPPHFLLVDAAGNAFLPTMPTDGCGKPRAEARNLLNELAFRTLSEVPLNQVQSQGSVDTGCSDSWKDELTIVGTDARPAPAKPASFTPTGSIRVCVYDRISGGDLPVGQFSRAHTISGDAAAALVAALNNAGPAAACSAPHTRFAVLSSNGTASWATVELDGCRRLLRPDYTLGQLDEPTVAPLIG